MSQTRYFNYGADLIAADVNEAQHEFLGATVLSGGVFSAVNNNLVVAPVTVALPDGIILVEDQSKTLVLDGIPHSAAKAFTIVYTHEDQNIVHGTAAVLEAYTGLQTSAQLPNSTILGWVRYPGGNIALNASHFIQVRTSSLSPNISKGDMALLNVKVPPFSSKFLNYSSSGSALTISDICDISDLSHVTAYTQIVNNTAGLGQITKVLPFVAGQYKPMIVTIDASADFDASITVTIIDETGEEITPDNNIITNTSTFVKREFNLNRNYYWLFAQGSTFLVKLTMSIAATKRIKIRSVGFSTYYLPV